MKDQVKLNIKSIKTILAILKRDYEANVKHWKSELKKQKAKLK